MDRLHLYIDDSGSRRTDRYQTVWPTSSGNALACVHMAIAMQKRVGELAHEWRNSDIQTALRCRVGIHTGYCTVGNFGSEDRMDYTMVGGTVNLASRLEHEAPPGGILISFETYAQVKDEVRCEERGAVQLKGIAQPISTYVVVGLKQEEEQTGSTHLRLELVFFGLSSIWGLKIR